MARRSGRSRTALSEASGGDQLPRWETVEGYVRACDGDPQTWRFRWERVQEQLAEARAATGPALQAPADEDVAAEATDAPVARRRRWFLAGVGVSAVLLAVALTLGVALRSPDSGPPTLGGEPGGSRLVGFAHLTPDELFVAGPGGVRIWNTTERRTTTHALGGGDVRATTAAFDALNRHVVSVGGADGLVRIFDTETGRPSYSVGNRSNGRVTAIAFDPYERYVLAVADSAGYVTLWNTTTGALLRRITLTSPPATLMTFDSLTRNRLATSSEDGPVTIWETDTGAQVRTLHGRTDHTVSLLFDPLTPNTLVTGHRGGTVRVWDSSNGKLVREFGGPAELTALAFHPLIRNSIACADSGGDVSIRDVTTGRKVHTLSGDAPVTSVAYALDGRTLAVAYADGDVRLWPIEDWQ
ncbi:WD domain-containing protein, G-beta repeat-containing protein [Cryptosporangium aurantiacum]|uniref:WD domain-containing protein, G-beta repeat-containing protein n=2 Tax=Cryptosporangium aurantiacum TaxID=134849 RepID=A0A1M7RAH2_9ACTN|nr:WD domain-containing protein, G-beta repeat-containing protein [Cryptosporangium aurantiacum]